LTFAFFAPRIIAQHDCDVVMSFDRIVKQDIIRSGGGPRKKLLEKLKSHSGFLKRFWYTVSLYHQLVVWIERLQVRGNKSGRIIAVCEQSKGEFTDVYGISDDQVVVVHNGVDCQRFHPRRREHEGRELRQRWNIPSDASVVLFVGTGFRRKGLDRMLELWAQNQLPGVYLLIVGNDAHLASYRKRWKDRREVIFAGPQDDVENYYASADLFVLPALQEAFGNVVLEALASGMPVVTVPGVGAMDRINGRLSQGILSDPYDPKELKAKILQMLNRSQWPSLAREAREAAETFTWENYLDQVERMLFECRRNSSGVASS
jgi:UDP-glucose:(heptosyl)LPS alpha-1,3-glucosyltransferase